MPYTDREIMLIAAYEIGYDFPQEERVTEVARDSDTVFAVSKDSSRLADNRLHGALRVLEISREKLNQADEYADFGKIKEAFNSALYARKTKVIRSEMEPDERRTYEHHVSLRVNFAFQEYKAALLKKPPETIFENCEQIAIRQEVVENLDSLLTDLQDLSLAYIAEQADPLTCLAEYSPPSYEIIDNFDDINENIFLDAKEERLKEAASTIQPDRMVHLLRHSYEEVKPVVEKLIQNPHVTREVLKIMTAELERPKPIAVPPGLLDKVEEKLTQLGSERPQEIAPTR